MISIPKITTRLFTCLLLAAPLAGCALSKIADSPAPQLFTLTAASVQDLPQTSQSRAQILVDEFNAPAVIDTTRIVSQLDANEIKYYAEGRWSDRAPDMLQTLIIETLETAGAFGAVAARQSGLSGDYFLVGDIRRFAAVEEGGTQARIAIMARLINARSGKILASRHFEKQVPVESRGINAIVSAYDGALHGVLVEMTLWSAGEVASVPLPSAAK